MLLNHTSEITGGSCLTLMELSVALVDQLTLPHFLLCSLLFHWLFSSMPRRRSVLSMSNASEGNYDRLLKV